MDFLGRNSPAYSRPNLPAREFSRNKLKARTNSCMTVSPELNEEDAEDFKKCQKGSKQLRNLISFVLIPIDRKEND